jgi:hypothetical protein
MTRANERQDEFADELVADEFDLSGNEETRWFTRRACEDCGIKRWD